MAAGQALEIDLVLGCAATSVAARDSTGVGPWMARLRRPEGAHVLSSFEGTGSWSRSGWRAPA